MADGSPRPAPPSLPRQDTAQTLLEGKSQPKAPVGGGPGTPDNATPHRQSPRLPSSSSSATLANQQYAVPSITTSPVHVQGQQTVNSPTQRPLEFGKLRVYVRQLLLNVPVKRPYVILTLGDQVFQTSVADNSDGNWNEGFEFLVTYHTQLFGTCQLDLWDSVTLLPDKHIGRTELRLALWDGVPADFTSYYEIWDRKLAPGTVSEVKKREALSTNIGAMQLRVCYRYQRLEDPPSKYERKHLVRVAGSNPASTLNQRVERRRRRASTSASRNRDRRSQGGVQLDPEADPGDSVVGREFAEKYDAAATHPSSDTPAKDGRTASKTRHSSLVNGADVDHANDGDASDSGDSIESDLGSWNLELGTLEDHGVTSDEDDTGSRTSHVPFKRNVEALSTQPGMMSYLSSMGSYVLPTDLHRLFQSTLRLIYAFNQGLEMTNTELLSGLLILQKYHYVDAQFHPRALPNPLTTSLAQVEKWGHYCKYALASYGWRGLYFFGKGGRGLLVDSVSTQADSRGVKEYLGLPDDDLLAYEFRPTVLFQPSYFLAYDRAASALVLSIRGTMSTQDTLVDLVCEYQKWHGGLVHSGIKAAANWLMLNVMPKALIHMKRHKVTSLVIVGHSLGGSTAALLTMMLLEQLLPPKETPSPADSSDSDNSTHSPPRLQTPPHNEAKSSSSTLPRSAKFKVRCFVYGAAPCVSFNLIRRYRSYITCFVYRDDFVCRLSYGSVFDIKGMIMAAAEMADALPQEILRSGWQCPEQLLSWIHEHWPARGVAFETIADLEAALKDQGVSASASDIKWLWRLRQLHQIRQEQHQDPHPAPKLYLPGQVYCLYPDSPLLTSSAIAKALETTKSPILSHVYQTHPDGLQEPEPLHLDTPHDVSSSHPNAMLTDLPNITALVSSPLERALQSSTPTQASTSYSEAYPTALAAPNATDLSPYSRGTSTSFDSLIRPAPTSQRVKASVGILDYFTQPFSGAPRPLVTAATTGTSLVKVQSRSPPYPASSCSGHPGATPATKNTITPAEAVMTQLRESSPPTGTVTPFSAARLSVSATSASINIMQGPRTVVKSVASDDFTELIIRPNMFPDHMPNVYEEAFARARESLMSGRVR